MFQRAGMPAQAWSAWAPTADAYAALPHATSSTRVDIARDGRRAASSSATRTASPWSRPAVAATDGLGLLVHLLGHEVRVAALLGGLDGPVDVVDGSLLLDAGDVGHADLVAGEVGHVALLEVHHAPRVGEDRGDVRREERLAVAEPDDERHVHPRPDQPLRLAAVEDRERIRPDRAPQRLPHGLRDVAAIGLLDEVRDDLGVGLRIEAMAGRRELGAQLDEVLDDPVVDDRQLAGAVDVRVGVEVARPAMGRPARVAEPARRRAA